MSCLLDIIEYRGNFSVTDPHLSGALSFIQPIGVRYTSFQKILMPFFTEVWIFLIITLLIMFAIDY